MWRFALRKILGIRDTAPKPTMYPAQQPSGAAYSATEVRQGSTGVWAFVLQTKEGPILARSSWGTNYVFDEGVWQKMKVVAV